MGFWDDQIAPDILGMARATVTVEELSVNGASYLQEVKMKCPESEEFSEFTPNHHTVNDCLE